MKYLFVLLLLFSIVGIFSCEDLNISESWAIEKFKEETGIENCKIDSVKRYAGQAIVFATITDQTKVALEKKFVFISDKDFLEKFHDNSPKSINYISFSEKLFNLDSSTNSHLSVTNRYLYYLKTYTNKSGVIATSYYVIILSKHNNKIIFTEAFNDL